MSITHDNNDLLIGMIGLLIEIGQGDLPVIMFSFNVNNLKTDIVLAKLNFVSDDSPGS